MSHFFILELNMEEGGSDLLDCTFFPLIFVLAAVVPSRRLQALIINMFRQKQVF